MMMPAGSRYVLGRCTPGRRAVRRRRPLRRSACSSGGGVTSTDSVVFQVLVGIVGSTMMRRCPQRRRRSVHRSLRRSADPTQELLGADIDGARRAPAAAQRRRHRSRRRAHRGVGQAVRFIPAATGKVAVGKSSRVARPRSSGPNSACCGTADLDFDGYGIGGCRWGRMRRHAAVLAATIADSPPTAAHRDGRRRSGDARQGASCGGVDEFDLRDADWLGRHGTALTSTAGGR